MQYVADNKDEGLTIKTVLRSRLFMSTRLIKNLKYHGEILKNGMACFVTEFVHEGDTLCLRFYEEVNSAIRPVCLLFEMVYETDHYCVVNKPKNMATHPSPGHYDDTLANALSYYWQERGESHVIRPINRLDKNTTGLMIVAKTQYAARLLTNELSSEEIKKCYVAIANGVLSPESGEINKPISRCEDSIIKRCVAMGGKESLTRYETISLAKDATFVRLFPLTGRTHQLRVHMAHIGHPLVGDTLYGNENGSEFIDRVALHCDSLSFLDPITGEKLSFTAPLPTDMVKLWSMCGGDF